MRGTIGGLAGRLGLPAVRLSRVGAALRHCAGACRQQREAPALAPFWSDGGRPVVRRVVPSILSFLRRRHERGGARTGDGLRRAPLERAAPQRASPNDERQQPVSGPPAALTGPGRKRPLRYRCSGPCRDEAVFCQPASARGWAAAARVRGPFMGFASGDTAISSFLTTGAQRTSQLFLSFSRFPLFFRAFLDRFG